MIWNRLRPALIGAATLILCSSCSKGPPDDGTDEVAPAPTASDVPTTLPLELDPEASCAAHIAQVKAEPALPGAPVFESNRAAVLAAAKAEPVLFIRAPQVDQNAPAAARHFRGMLRGTKHPWDYLRSIAPSLRENLEVARGAILTEGYLYAEEPDLAFALQDLIGTDHLTRDDRIWIQRGEVTMVARRQPDGSYQFVDGPHEGARVRLLHLDRIGTGAPPEPLHRDLRSLQHRLHFERLEVQHLTRSHVVADLRYGKLWISTLLRAEGARLELECEQVSAHHYDELEALRYANQRRSRAVQVLRGVILDQIDERLPFDEPLTEVGQQDGALRWQWQWAHAAGRDSYRVNGDTYRVFDSAGKPLVPQVCVDFISDTLERASGTWWSSRGEVPERTIGRLNLDQIVGTQERRRVSGLQRLAAARPDWLAGYAVPESRQIRLGHKKRVFSYLASHADTFAPGDMVIVRGHTPREERLFSSHSVFVFMSDPVTGMPILLAGNAGRPALRTWQFEALRTPKRVIAYRLRPSTQWLEQLTGAQSETTLAVAPIGAGDI